MKFKKIKYKKRIITLSSLLTIVAIFHLSEPLKTVSNLQILKKRELDFDINQNNLELLAKYIRKKNPNILIGEEKRLIKAVVRESKFLNLPKNSQIENKEVDSILFLIALIETESTFNKYAISYANARGYMQILPLTALWFKEKEKLSISLSEIHSTEINIMLGVKYLNYLSSQFEDLKSLCLAYNVGEGNFKNGIYDIQYWIKIVKNYKEVEDFIKENKY